MNKFSVNYDELSTSVEKKVFRLADVKHRLVKVAFDIVRFKDGDDSQLWQVQSSDDGEYIVSLYSEEEAVKTAAPSDWKVVISKLSGDLNFFYKGDRLVKVASSKLGLPANELDKAQGYLPQKLATNKKLVEALLKELSVTEKTDTLRKYPELA